jgi:hypothetical protein
MAQFFLPIFLLVFHVFSSFRFFVNVFVGFRKLFSLCFILENCLYIYFKHFRFQISVEIKKISKNYSNFETIQIYKLIIFLNNNFTKKQN